MEEGGRKTFIIRASSNVHSRRNERRGGEETHSRADNAKKRFPRFGTVPIGYDRHKSGRPDHVNLLFVSQLSLKSARDIPLSRSLRLFPRFLPILTSIFGGKKSIDIDIDTKSIRQFLTFTRTNRSDSSDDRSIDRSITRQSV